jgi:hypothetical protein
MRDIPDFNDEYDCKEWKDLNAPEWMIDLLKKNPEYNSWGNGEDYMCSSNSGGWESSQEIHSVSELYELDELNELVNFHFQVVRNSHIHDEEHGHLELQMWIILPRKGASRGCLLTRIEESEVSLVIAYLKNAAQRNADRFGKL